MQGAVSNQQDVSNAWKNNYSFEGESLHEMLLDLQERVGTAELSLEEQKIQEVQGDVDNLVELAQQPEVIKIVNLVFLEAVLKRASDITSRCTRIPSASACAWTGSRSRS